MTIQEILSSEWQLTNVGYILSDEGRLKEFAKFHCNAALEAAVEKGTATLHCRDYYDEHIVIDENSILTAYPENLIK